MLLSGREVENFGVFFFYFFVVCFNIRSESNTLLMNISEINEMKCNAFHAMQP